MGCGWLGLPLAKAWVSEGHRVNGSTTSREKLQIIERNGIRPYLIEVSESGIQGPMANFLSDMDLLVLNLPPRLRNRPGDFVAKMRQVYDALAASTVKKIILVSSTSVYGRAQGEVCEKDPPRPDTESGRQLVAVEAMFRDMPDRQVTILRFAGLIGPRRHPVTMLSGRTGLANGQDPVNLVHMDDCIGIMQAIVKNDWFGHTLNVVYPEHPPKADYYAATARKRGIPPPEYVKNYTNKGKKIYSCSPIIVNFFTFKTSILP